MRAILLISFLCIASVSQAQLTLPRSIVFSRTPLSPQSELELPQWNPGLPVVLSADPTLPARLNAALEATYAKTSLTGQHGVCAAIIVPGMPIWKGGIGESYPGMPMNDQLLFEIASNTKTITTALIFQLQDEGKLSINDSLWKWLPHYDNIDSTITIKQLLEHSSGIFDYLNDDPNNTVISDAYVFNPDKVWTPEEIASTIIGPANFKAGKSYKYSNTNFLLLGMIAEKASGVSVAEQFNNRFFTPLQLSNSFAGWDGVPSQEFAHNWADTSNNPTPKIDISSINKTAQLTSAHSAGGVVSIPEDLVHWGKALYSGILLSKTAMAQMLTFHTWPDGSVYGRGVGKAGFGNKTLYGHSGRLIGFTSQMFSDPKDSVSIVVYMNSDPSTGDMSVNDYTIALLTEVFKPVSAVAKSETSAPEVSVYPNPISSKAVVSFELHSRSSIRLSLYDMLGREVQQLYNGMLSEGKHSLRIDAASLPVGSYRYELVMNSTVTNGLIEIVR